ncbi:nickel-dependent hydrogenase large subunit [Caminibacter mediatlanticus]|uniref:Nickel-dependent hydrogenase, large subunit n=1 Tax=Caminibacter mediatlanticus TB-2 TaxID=391592 RepID=A0AAI9AIB3_9BACT|nr:nickel-dependent hydrogenase large subunit [Caminibacter mediatlanticus]EDM24029.1 Nickel-dependent hydrogenase, large subunit [Caminibacter mediatlanticus TB-2]
MKITKKIINKIEGEAELKIYQKDGIIDFVEIFFWQYRGIEQYLVNRHFLDALVINPRICGICGHAHLLATAKAIENALNLKITKKAEILRDITSGLEIIQNHIKWFYLTLYPTQIKDKSYILKALNIVKKISKIIAIIGGQFPHNSYIIPGGVTCDLTNLDIIKIKNLLKKLREDIYTIIDENGKSHDLEKFFENLPKNIGKSLNKFLVLGDNLFFKPNGTFTNVKEFSNNSFFKNVLYNEEYYEVGPLARNLQNKTINTIYEKYQDSIYTRIFARLYEILLIINYLIKEIEDLDITQKSFLNYKKRTCGSGVSVIEAPRGSLIHKIKIENEKIKFYDIVMPSQFYLSNGTKEKPSASQMALIREEIKFIDTIFKCFDICAVCVTH